MTDFSDANRFAPPKAELAEPGQPDGGLELGGRWTRLGAVFLDGLFGWLIMLAVNLITGAGIAGIFASLRPHPGEGAMAAMFLMFRAMAPAYVLMIAIQAWFLYSGGHTLGKKALGLRIVRTDGSRAGFVRLFFVRAGLPIVLSLVPLFGSIFALVDMLMIFRASRRCLHDQIADTIVVTMASSKDAARA